MKGVKSNAPRIAEREPARRDTERLRAEIRADLAAANAYAAKHGWFAEVALDHYGRVGE